MPPDLVTSQSSRRSARNSWALVLLTQCKLGGYWVVAALHSATVGQADILGAESHESSHLTARTQFKGHCAGFPGRQWHNFKVHVQITGGHFVFFFVFF